MGDILAEKVFQVPEAAPAPYPDEFGHEKIEGHEWQMLGNGPDDSVQPGFEGAGDCVWAGACEETIILGTEGGHHPGEGSGGHGSMIRAKDTPIGSVQHARKCR